MRVLMLLSNEYRPDPRVRKEALTLQEAGHEITILCWNRSHNAPDHQDDGGVTIERVRTGKVGGGLALGLNTPLFFIKAYLRSRHLKFDAVHCHDFDTLMLGAFIARLRRVPLVYDSHEWYSKMVAKDLPSYLCGIIERTESLLMPNCTTVIAANDAVADHLRTSGAIDVTVVMNCISLPPDDPRQAYQEKKEVSLFYGGSLEPGRFVKEMLEVAKEDADCHLQVAGNGRLTEYVKEAARSCDRIKFLGYIPQDKVLLNVSQCDVVVSMLDPSDGNYAIATPIKLLEAMAFGVPAIVTEGTHSADLVKRLDCGAAVEYSVEGMKLGLSFLKDARTRKRMGRNGRAAAETDYNWSVMRERLIGAYSSLPKER